MTSEPDIQNVTGHRLPRWLLFAVTIGLLIMAVLPFVLDRRGQALTFATERGFVERASIHAWLSLAVCIPIALRRISLNILAAAGTCLACAAREADLHKPSPHVSILGFNYYGDASHPLWQRALIGVVVALALALAVITVIAIWRHATADGFRRSPWLRVLTLAVGLGVSSKAADRTPDVLEQVGLKLPAKTREVMRALEEGAEFLVPVLMFPAIILFAAQCDRSPRKDAQ